MRCVPAVLALFLSVASACANELPIITNVSSSSHGDTVVVRFDVLDPDDDGMQIHLRAAGSELRIPPDAPGLSGDTGPGLVSGTEKEITLALSQLAAELPGSSIPEPFIPRLLSYDGQGFGGEMITVESSGGPDFMIDKYEVTNEQFAAFMRQDGYEVMGYWIIDDGTIEIEETGWNYAGRFQWEAPRYWDLSARPPWSTDPDSPYATSPVLGVSWFECYAYCKWAGRRLPSSGEWREAAGVSSRTYPWGDELAELDVAPEFSLANIKFGYDGYEFGGFTSDRFETAAPVGSYSPQGDSPLGLVDAYGNVWEWCNDVVAVVDYGTFSCATRPIKGGSWATSVALLEDPTKDLCPLYRTDTAGFRTAR